MVGHPLREGDRFPVERLGRPLRGRTIVFFYPAALTGVVAQLIGDTNAKPRLYLITFPRIKPPRLSSRVGPPGRFRLRLSSCWSRSSKGWSCSRRILARCPTDASAPAT